MAASRTELLKLLAEYPLPIEPVLAELSEFPFDCEDPLFVVTRQHVTSVLDRYSKGTVSADQVADWADLIECRDDLDFEVGFEDILRQTIFELANPYLTQAISPDVADIIRRRLHSTVA